MSYIEQFEAELLAKLNGKEDEASVVRWVSEKVLESYRNGIKAGQGGATVIRQGKSRRRGSYGKPAPTWWPRQLAPGRKALAAAWSSLGVSCAPPAGTPAVR